MARYRWLALACVIWLTTGCSLITAAGVAPPAVTRQPEPVSVVVWDGYSGVAANALQGLVDRYNAAHRGRQRVTLVQQGSPAQLRAAIDKAYVEGGFPNAIIGDADLLRALSRAGRLAPAQQLIDAGVWPLDLVQDIPPALRASLSDGVRLLGLPLGAVTTVLYVNTDAVKRVPETWDELAASALAATGLQADGQTRYGLGVRPNEGAVFLALIEQAGGAPVNVDGTAAFASEAGNQAALYLQSLEKAGSLLVTPDPVTAFARGQVAMWLGSSAEAVPLMQAVAGRKVWTSAPLPRRTRPAQGVTAMGGGILSGGTWEQQQAAGQLLAFLAEPENDATWAVEASLLPARLAAYRTPLWLAYAARHPGLTDGIRWDGAFALPGTEAGPLLDELGQAMAAVLAGQNPRAVLTKAADQYNAWRGMMGR